MIYDGQLSGCPISEELEVNSLSGSDSFVISMPLNGKSESNFYRSRSITYDTLRNDIYSALYSKFKLGTMAAESSSDYEFRIHDHFGRYSVVSVEQHYFRDRQIQDEFQDTVIVLGHIVVNGVSYDICLPKINQDDVPKILPKIGTLKFVATPNIQDIDVNSEDFDGWVFPDGRQVSKTRFPDAYRMFGYGQQLSGDLFSLPILSDFIELNPYKQPTESTRKINYNIALKSHSHEISQVNISGNFELEGSVRDYGIKNPVNTYTSYHHGTGYDPEPSDSINTKITFSVNDMNFSSGDSTYNTGVDHENYPEHIRIPVLMFIGEPIR